MNNNNNDIFCYVSADHSKLHPTDGMKNQRIAKIALF